MNLKDIESIIEKALGLIDTDEKRLKIINEPIQIFELGYYMCFIEKYFSKKRIDIDEIKKIIDDEDFYVIHQKIIDLQSYYYEQRGKYSF
jgi:hypothetical protein